MKETSSDKISSLRVRLVPDLSAAALRHGQTKELSMWYRLRYLNLRDYGGSGSFPLVKAMGGLMDTFSMSRSTAYRVLALGEDNFWRRADSNGKVTLHIMSLKNVCRHLNTNLEFNRHYRDVTVAEFTGSIRQTRAQLYASIHEPAGIRSNPISRQSITEFTGLAKQQQRRYEIEAHVKRFPNFVVSYDEEARKTEPQFLEVFSKNKTYLVPKRAGNIYHSRQEASRKGMQDKVSRSLRGQESFCSAGAASNLTRRFYGSLKRLQKSFRQSGGEGYYLVQSNFRTIRGRLEWAAISI